MTTVSFNMLGNYGRLGNAMFQYAATLGSARSSGHTPVCNISAIPLLSECFELGSVVDGVVDFDLVYTEDDFKYNPVLNSLPADKSIELRGYFQTRKYFSHVEDEVRQNFKFKDHIIEKARQKIPVVDWDACVSVHVRRGDYPSIAEHHHNQTVEYYISSLDNFPYHRPVFFSDDIEWCKENFSSLKNEPVFVENDETLNLQASQNSDISGYVDMCGMGLCDGHIIANSSFSWWGAFLGGEGQTVAPKIWFGPKGPQDWQDVYCKEWIVN